MRKYNYRQEPVPGHLNLPKIIESFNDNNFFREYTTGSIYNDSNKTVKNALKKIYYYKCAYCESPLNNAYGEIEHYRPKKSSNLTKCNSSNGYYWLAFSWDNLIPCCEICNKFKSNCFDIFNEEKRFKEYNTEQSFNDLHNSLVYYNNEENPKLLHPEIDNVENEINFLNKGQIISSNEKVKYTLRICKLNRKGLNEVREKILTKYQRIIKKTFLAVLIPFKEGRLNFNELENLLKVTFDEIHINANIKEPYSLVSYYVFNNFTTFINHIPRLKTEDKLILNELWTTYKKRNSE